MTTMRQRFILILLFMLPVVLRAQSVHWQPSDSGSSNIQLVFEDCSPDGNPELPSVPGLTFTEVGETSTTNIVNFDVHRSIIITYIIRSRQNAAVQIPAFSVKTTQGVQRVPAFNAAAPAAPSDSVASSKLIPERASLWAGEVFGLTYELTASRRNNPQISPNFDWNPAPLVIEDWSKPEVTEDAGGDRRARVTFRTRAVARTPNTVKLDAASHLLGITTGTVGFGFFTQARVEQISVTSDQPVLTVRPLPPAPAGFGGAVGQFKLISKVVPEKAAVGEPVTWTLEFSGTGNWPDIDGLPQRDVSTDFKVVQPKAKRTPTEGKVFDATLNEDVVLVPTKPGTYTLGPVNVVCFDPKTGSYKTLTAPRTTVTVTAPDAPKFNFNIAPPTGAETTPPATETKSSAPPAVPAAPAGIPRDPLPGADTARAPLATDTLAGFVLTPFALPLLAWAWLAIRRAQRTDPIRPRREARARLAATLTQMRTAPLSPQLLLAWQRDTAVLWEIVHAAPPASAITDAAWTQLWLDCDRALYGAKTELPSDWTARAEAALEAKRVRGFNPFRAFLPRNLFPFAALLALSLISISSLRAADVSAVASAKAEDGASAYRRGDFAAAEKAWRATLEKNSTDWISHHNLSLALAQQDRAGESAAHAAAAFVQHPANPAVRWHLALSGEKAGFAPGSLAAFLNPGAAQSLAEHASPAEWQLALIGAASLAALAITWMLVNAYGRRARIVRVAASALLVVSLAGAVIAVVGWQTFGTAGDARAVVVWRNGTLRSIPTEADIAQKTTSLGAGSVALADKTFLGWTRLTFDNGQTGWVRTGELVGLWR